LAEEASDEAAIVPGGKDNGPPGLLTGYRPNRYGAFVLDRDGHNIETVCHKNEQTSAFRPSGECGEVAEC